MNIAIVHGQIDAAAAKDEQDTLVEVQTVAAALTELGHQPVAVPIGLNLAAAAAELRRLSPARVFNLAETLDGQGRFIQVVPALLESLQLPYTGATADAIFLTSNKLLAKKLLRGANLPTPRWLTVTAAPNDETFSAGLYILKSVWEHASIGLADDSVRHADTAADLRRALGNFRERLRGDCFAEQYIDGREFNVTLLDSRTGPEVLPPAEICFVDYPADRRKIVDYAAKWDEASFACQHTQRRFDFPAADAPLLERLKTLAQACWQTFELRGYARVDFRVDAAQAPYILEINTNPCLAPDAGFIAATRQAGYQLNQVIERILTV